MRRLLQSVTVVVLFASTAFAQGIVNPSQVTWNAPTTNADGTPLVDLGGYSIRITGPLPTLTTPCPAYTPAAYPMKGTKASAVKNPAAGRVEAFGTAGSRNLAGELGLTVDGAYCVAISAVDDALNESGGSTPDPFLRNVIAPSAPSGTKVVQ